MTSQFGRTIPRSRTRCRRCPSESGRWGSPRPRSSRSRGSNGWPSRALERQSLDEASQIRPRLTVRSGNRLQRRRAVHICGNALHDSFLVRGDVFALEEHADRDPVPPLERLLQRLCGLLLQLKRFVDDRIISFVLELVHPREGAAVVRLLPVLPTVPFLRVDVVI